MNSGRLRSSFRCVARLTIRIVIGDSRIIQAREKVANGSSQLRNILLEGDHVEQRRRGLHVDENVDVAIGPVVATRARTEYADVARAVTRRNIESFTAETPDGLERHGLNDNCRDSLAKVAGNWALRAWWRRRIAYISHAALPQNAR